MTTLDGAVDLARDRELVERCQTGDESAFAELYDRYHRRLLRFSLRRLHSHDDAEEAVQEAFTRAWRALPNFGGDRRFYPWLTVIAANVCTDMLRRRARVVPMHEMPMDAVQLDGEEVDAQLLRQVDLAMASEAFTHLSDRHQRVLRLRESTEWSAQRIAESEGVAVPAVDTLLWRARQAFKREFAMLSDTGSLAGVLGIGMAAIRRGISRAWLRVASCAPTPMRGPGAIAAAVALTGAAIAGGSVALVGSGPAPHAADGAIAPASPTAAGLPGASSRTAAATSGSAGPEATGTSGRTGHTSRRRHAAAQDPLDGVTGVSGLPALGAGTGNGTPGAANVTRTAITKTAITKTALGVLFTNVGGLGGLGGTGASSSSTSGGAGAPTANRTGNGTGSRTVGGLIGGISGTTTSATGSAAAGTVATGSGTSGTTGTTGTSGTSGTPGSSGASGSPTAVWTLTAGTTLPVAVTTLPVTVPKLSGGSSEPASGPSS